ncbi:hypothetical protein J4456_02315 [Candidatus Pacearchaeota archaeon]|nr:hypothetical protein [Candidatus Pacearchaeota archaeon]
MEKQDQKRMFYEALLDLTENSGLSKSYFTPKRILGHVRYILKRERLPSQTLLGCFIDASKREISEKFLYETLNELIKEGRVEHIIGETGCILGDQRSVYDFYRAVIKDN